MVDALAQAIRIRNPVGAARTAEVVVEELFARLDPFTRSRIAGVFESTLDPVGEEDRVARDREAAARRVAEGFDVPVELVADEVPGPRPPFVGGVFVGHDHASLGEVEEEVELGGIPPVSGVFFDEAHVWRGLSGFAELAGEVLVEEEPGSAGGIPPIPGVAESVEEARSALRARVRRLDLGSVRVLSFGPTIGGLGAILSVSPAVAPDDEVEAGRRAILSSMARDGFPAVVLGNGSCLRCGAVSFERVGWPVPVGLVFEGFAPGRPLCSSCALRLALSMGDDVWLAEELVVEPGPVEGKLRIRPTEVVVVPAGEVAARILRELGR